MKSLPTVPEDLQAEILKYDYICGSDECGYGSWAGPLIVCAAVVPRAWVDSRVNDSKQLTARAREKLAPELARTITHCIVEVENTEIDARGVGKMLMDAHSRAIAGALQAHAAKMPHDTPIVIIDGNRGVPGAIPLPKADALIPAVGAASIIGKVHHDRIMQTLHARYPDYGFNTNMGYRSPVHVAGLEKLGVTPVHRMSYSPMSQMARPTSEPQDLFALIDALDS